MDLIPNIHLYVLILQALRESLDSGKSLAFPDGLLINGQAHSTINGDQGQSFPREYSSTFLQILGKPFNFFIKFVLLNFRKDVYVQNLQCGNVNID